MIEWLAKKMGYTKKVQAPPLDARMRHLLSRFDSARTTDQTGRHWQYADGLAADAAADPTIRALLRNRGRHERFNNPYMAGQLRTLANDVVGVSPHLQMDSDNDAVNNAVEDRWRQWGRRIRLSMKLRTLRECRVSDGELFVRVVKNPKLKHPVKLDLQLIESDQCQTPFSELMNTQIKDGIEVDEYDNPVWYYFLTQHPGDTHVSAQNPFDFIRVPAADIIHYWKLERAGQHHGIPEVVSSLNLHAERRAYRQSVISAARAVASLGAVILETQSPPDEDALPSSDTTSGLPYPFDTLAVEQGMLTMAPYGTTARQMKPEQPSTGYKELTEQSINEQARPINMPFNVAAGDSSRYNYASGRLDHQVYDRSNAIDQDDMEIIILDPVLQQWSIDAVRVKGYLPRRSQIYLPSFKDPDFEIAHEWIWGERDHVDPAKESQAQERRLGNRTTTYAAEYAKQRRDWRRQIAQSGVELEAMGDAGLVDISPQMAPHIIAGLTAVPVVGETAVIEMLVTFGIPRGVAGKMVKAVEPMVDAVVRPAPSPGNNGNGSPKNAHPEAAKRRV